MALALSLVLAGTAEAQSACANAAASNPGQAGDGLLCLVNAVRERSGLPRLGPSGRLASIAGAHAHDMVFRRYFSHISPEGRGYEARLQAIGYPDLVSGWRAGENIAWGTGAMATPSDIMRRWMNSAKHRANILKPAFRRAGVAAVGGTPFAQPLPGLTYVMDFGDH